MPNRHANIVAYFHPSGHNQVILGGSTFHMEVFSQSVRPHDSARQDKNSVSVTKRSTRQEEIFSPSAHLGESSDRSAVNSTRLEGDITLPSNNFTRHGDHQGNTGEQARPTVNSTQRQRRGTLSEERSGQPEKRSTGTEGLVHLVHSIFDIGRGGTRGVGKHTGDSHKQTDGSKRPAKLHVDEREL